jgi:hypothetical protein
MKDKSSRDACRDGKDSAPPPIRENAKGKYHQDSQYGDFGNDQSHGTPLPCEAFGSTVTQRCAACDAYSSPGTLLQSNRPPPTARNDLAAIGG